MRKQNVIWCSIITWSWLILFQAGIAEERQTAMHISIDARDLPRRLLNASLTIPVESRSEPQDVLLWYPKWVPGSHGPGGPIANIAGLSFEDGEGNSLAWKRSGGEVYQLSVRVPSGTSSFTAKIRYVTNQPTTNSMGHDSFGSAVVGVISPSNVLLYRDGDHIDEQRISTELILPLGWTAATALALDSSESATDSTAASAIERRGHAFRYGETSLRNFVDSPIMCGLYYESYSLGVPTDLSQASTGKELNAEAKNDINIAPHTLHVFGENKSSTRLDASIRQCLNAMVVQTAKLTGSQPFDRFHILLAITDDFAANGLEHSRSTFNVLPPASLKNTAALKGWSRLLIPHEYLHAWCGKYRRPEGMMRTDFHTPKDTDLLWVYEGLTQYLGELVEARCGLMTVPEFRHRLSVELRNAMHQQNRLWRPLLDTAAASHLLRSGSPSWAKVRGSQDYYMEGMLFWIEADTLIRNRTNGVKSLEDFCHLFFDAKNGNANAVSSTPNPFTREEVIATLDETLDFDWEGLVVRRIEQVRQGYPLDMVPMLGYRFEQTAERPKIPSNTFRLPNGVDHYDSVGLIAGKDGVIRDVRLESPADLAGLGPGMKIIAVEGMKWSEEYFDESILDSNGKSRIELLVEIGNEIRPIQLQYRDGPRYWSLLREEAKPDVLEQILMPR